MTMNVIRLSLLTMIVAAIVVQTVAAEDPASPDGSRRINDIPYAEADGHQLLLDLYLPKEAHRPPLVVGIHWGTDAKRWSAVPSRFDSASHPRRQSLLLRHTHSLAG